jgi:NADH-quinone oxidoreductase subunit D
MAGEEIEGEGPDMSVAAQMQGIEVVERTSDEMVLNMGPQHPSTHGVLRLLLRTDGEVVNDAEPHIGYLHRDFEKHSEQVFYNGVIPYTDRMDYVGAMNNNVGYCIAVERLMKLEIPERAEYLRVIVCELNRIASHLLAFGTYGIDIGAFTPFLYAFRERERILDLFEMLCGARLTYNYPRVGGVSKDIDSAFVSDAKRFLKDFRRIIPDYHGLLSNNQIFIRRTANVGVLPADLAVAYGVTGPCLRASGVDWDLRRDEPYSVYPKFRFKIPIGLGERGTVGDCWDRYMVRLREAEVSIDILEQALDGIPEGPIMAPGLKAIRPPKGEVYVRTETPRGELGFYLVSDGGRKPFRLKARAPSFCNLSVFREISRGYLLSDIVAIIGSIDIVLGEVDR